MTNISNPNPIPISFYGFLVYDTENPPKPLYTQYNFKFTEFKNDYGMTGPTGNNDIFKKFLEENKTDFTKPYTVDAGLTGYFTPMTTQKKDDIINYINKYGFIAHYGRLTQGLPSTYKCYEELIEEQYELIEYKIYDSNNAEIPIVEDFYYEDDSGLYTKYNFKFDDFSTDFQVYGSKRFVFTNFLIRNQVLSGVIVNSPSYGLYSGFKKYFDTSDKTGLRDYLKTYSVTSVLNYTPKNYYNIDWQEYINSNVDLTGYTIVQAQEQFYNEGQFELRPVVFKRDSLTDIEKYRNSVCKITVNNNTASGFRFKYKNCQNPEDDNVYIITSYHIFAGDLNVRLFYATFEYNADDGSDTSIITGQFRLIGKDSLTDLAFGLFDPTLPYNEVNQIDLSMIDPIELDQNYKVKLNDKIFQIGNVKSENLMTITKGYVIDIEFNGSLEVTDFNCANYIISAVLSGYGMSGGPLFVQDEQNDYHCVGMVLQTIKGAVNTSVTIKVEDLAVLIDVVIYFWNYYTQIYNYDYSKFENLIDYSLYRTWLGVVGEYYIKEKHANDGYLSSFYYTGGFIVRNIIQGFNYKTRQFVYNTYELNNYNVIKLNTPLNNSTINKRLIDTGAPIIIKKIELFHFIYRDYKEFIIGKYADQVSLVKLSSGISFIALNSTLDPNFLNNVVFKYGKVVITYSYFNGLVWLDDIEEIGGNGPEWYTTYNNPSQIKRTIHRFQIPPFISYYVSDALNNFTNIRYLAETFAPIERLLTKQRDIAGTTPTVQSGQAAPPPEFVSTAPTQEGTVQVVPTQTTGTVTDVRTGGFGSRFPRAG